MTHFTDLSIEAGFMPTNEALLYYEKAGNGNSVVFVHGFALDCRMWNEQFFKFAKHFQVIRYDARGFGKSSLPTEKPYSHHDDLNSILRQLGIETACFIGLSMGGRIVLDYALKFPDSCSSLVLVDAALTGYTFKTFSLDKSYLAAKESGIERANEEWLNHDLFYSTRSNIAVSNLLREIISTYSGWHWLNTNPLIPINPPSIEQLNKIKQPALVIAGQSDLPDFHDISDILSTRIPNAEKVIIPNAGHMCNMENPILFNKIVEKFIQSTT